MAEAAQPAPALKEIFDRSRLQHFASETATIWPGFDSKRFIKLATADLDSLGIMQRMRQTAVSLHETLPANYHEALSILEKLAPRIGHNFAAITLSEFVALYGLQDFDRSMRALHFFTRFGSAEFAIRYFLRQDFDRTLSVMHHWARDENEHVRRLASEGSRPRLPWSFQLKQLVADPSPTWPILHALRRDPSPYVRKSVANHLNDISKDHASWLIGRLSDWPKDGPETAWIVRHALRTQIKSGNPLALGLIGATGKAEVAVTGFTVVPAEIRLGERIAINTIISSTADKTQRLVVDYAIHYVKKNGAASRKVFKLKELDLAPGASAELRIGQTVRDFTTRKHHAGFHCVELMVNGQVLAESGFHLHI